jgi:bacterioferritin-associated ferredoxin
VIVCHCERVSDRAIRHAIADGAGTIDEITARCGAGGNCGGCVDALESLLLNAERAANRVPRWRRHLVPQHAAAS